MFSNTHKKGTTFREVIYQNNSEARERAALIGADKVINGTVGALMDRGTLVTFKSVDDLIPSIDIKKISAYTPMQGIDSFLTAIEHLCFDEEFAPDKKIGSVAVVGGLGGIRQAIINYTEIGDAIVTSDWHWGPYDIIVKDNYRKIATFELFQDKSFNLESFKETIEKLAKSQKNVFILLNTPAHNPTGYSITLQEWDRIIDFLNTVDRNIILFLDVAYVEFSKRKNKQFFQKITCLDSHIFTIVNYSISKGLTKYGLRTAALIGIHEEHKAIEEFINIISTSNRGTYGSAPSLGQYLTAALYENKTTLTKYYTELSYWKNIITKRAAAFMNNINSNIVTPYESGFFISIKSDMPEDHVNRLKKDNIFLVPLSKGIRVAICSIEEENIKKVTTALNRMIENL